MRILVIALTVVGLLYLPFIVPLSSKDNHQNVISTRKQPVEQVQEDSSSDTSEQVQAERVELYKNVLITALNPIIYKSLSDYYGNTVSGYDPADVAFLDIIRPNGYSSREFLVKIRVSPYKAHQSAMGPHELTFRVTPGGVYLHRFKHSKSPKQPAQLKETRKVL